MRILRELHDEPPGTRELQDRCDRTSSSVLYDRLDELTGAAADPGRG
jgi:DNA-binding HxlR family transcriptional regulator